MLISESPAESSLLEPRIDCKLNELETERVDEIINEGAVCDTQNEVYHLEERSFEEPGSKECCEKNAAGEALENGAVELTSKGTEVVVEEPSVLLVDGFNVKDEGNSTMEANQAAGVLCDSIGELPVEALTSNKEEGDKDDVADAAGDAEMVPEKVMNSKKIVKKKKTVKWKAGVAEDEENPDSAPSGEAKRSRRVRKRKKKNSQQLSETRGAIYEAKPEPSEKNMDHLEAKSEGKVKKLKKRKRNQGDAAKGNAGESEKAGPSKSPDKVKTMGMIFMCSSKTKQECFRHNLLGLPASKKDIVLSIYKGMRLFLFDFQSRLLYGIYKAKGPGGYNIEPDVFNSNFPSQVRFTIFKDCSPLPEEQFKNVIKDNYYAKNKFDCQLNPDQVKDLCKLFSATTNKKTKSVGETPTVRARPIFEQKKKRRAEDDADRDRKKKRPHNDGKREIERRRPNDNGRWPNDDGRRPFDNGRRTYEISYPNHAVVYEREAYLPRERSTLSYVALTPPAQAAPAYTLSYPYGRTSVTDIHEQERAIGRQDRGLAYSRLRYLDEGSSDPYSYPTAVVREDRGLAYSRLNYLDEVRADPYTEPVVYRDPRYYTSARRDSSSAAVPEDEYRPSSSRTSYYGYRVPLPPHRRY